MKRAYLLVRVNWRSAFPRLVSYKQWIARLHALSALVGQLLSGVRLRLSEADNFYLLDSKPIPVCHPLRHGRVRLLREDGAYFGKCSRGWFFGFKLHLLTASRGHLLGAVLTPANWGDRDPALALSWMTQGGATLGDLGYTGERAINEADAAQAMKLCDDAGIDITRKAIWRDRLRILKGLQRSDALASDQELISWLEERGGR